MSASPVLSVPCLPSFVSLSGGVRLSGLVCALSPFMCLPEWWCPPLQSCLCLVSLHLSPFTCLPSFVSRHVSPEWWCPLATALSGLVMAMVAGVAMILVVVVVVADGSNGSGSYGNGSGNGRLEW